MASWKKGRVCLRYELELCSQYQVVLDHTARTNNISKGWRNRLQEMLGENIQVCALLSLNCKKSKVIPARCLNNLIWVNGWNHLRVQRAEDRILIYSLTIRKFHRKWYFYRLSQPSSLCNDEENVIALEIYFVLILSLERDFVELSVFKNCYIKKTFCNVNEIFNFSKKFRYKLEPLTNTLYQYLAQGAARTTPPLEKLTTTNPSKKGDFYFYYLRTLIMQF